MNWYRCIKLERKADQAKKKKNIINFIALGADGVLFKLSWNDGRRRKLQDYYQAERFAVSDWKPKHFDSQFQNG